jgi:predicted permease
MVRHLRIAGRRFRSLFRAAREEAEIRSELELHCEQLTREYMSLGLAEAEARRRARLEFGPLEGLKEECRDMRRVSFARDVVRDVAYACRLFGKSPGFTIAAVLSLALGIGANTAIFSVVNAVLLRSLPVPQPGQLVEVSREGGLTLSYPVYEAIRDRNDVFAGVLLTSAGRFGASLRLGGTDAGDVHFSPVSGNYFSVLGLSPILGRALTEEDLPASNTAMISERLWERAFGRDPTVVGKTMRLGRSNYTVVGVAPPGFSGVITGHTIDVWVPITWFEQRYLQSRDALMFRLIARRKPEVTQDQVRANVDLVAHHLSTEWSMERPMHIEVADGSGGLTILRRQFSRPLWALMTVVALLLLLATVNVANLLLARAGARRREIAVRLSIGATRQRLVRQLLTESLMLGGVGGLLGLLLAPAAATALVRFLSSAVGPLDLQLNIDARVFGFTLVVSLIVAALFGLAPALAATRVDVSAMLKGVPARRAAGERGARPGRWLVVTQVAISCVLLATAILFARSLRALTQMDAGFRRENVLLLSVGLEPGKVLAAVERVRIYDRVVDRLTRIPGVHSAAYSSEQLFSGNSWTEPVNTPTFTPVPGQERQAVLLVISPQFFATMGSNVLRGRSFTFQDDERAPRVAIVNEAAARYYFGGTDPVGRSVQIGEHLSSDNIQIVGIVQDAKYRSLKAPAPRMIYLPALQVPDAVTANLAIRTSAAPETMADLLWNEARDEVRELRWRSATTQARLVDGTIAQDRMLAQLSAVFGFTAMALACLGLYGLTAYEVSRRTAEVGVRLALGASRADVVRLIAGRSMLLVAGGVAVGVGASAVLSRLIESLLFGVRGTDIVSLATAALLLLTTGLAGSLWPARRAARLNPTNLLRVQ